ncbi:MAG: hypothetical protein M3O20_05645 [Acidobacteriota bacterium]|nr:hypothetical protein [Acidobacteriota bacterium]
MTCSRFVAALLLLSGAPAICAELELRYGALERVIADQLFSQEGRLYVRGSKATKCKFAYLESPHVGALDGRLRVTGRFSGRTALDMFGGCVGLGDSFDFTLIAVPVVKNGALAFNQVNVSTPRDSFYIRRVRQALSSSFSHDFKIEVRDQARHLLEQAPATGVANGAAKPLYQEELASFDLRDVRVQPDAVVLVMDFRLVVK